MQNPEILSDYKNPMLRTAQLSKSPSFSPPLAALRVEARGDMNPHPENRTSGSKCVAGYPPLASCSRNRIDSTTAKHKALRKVNNNNTNKQCRMIRRMSLQQPDPFSQLLAAANGTGKARF